MKRMKSVASEDDLTGLGTLPTATPAPSAAFEKAVAVAVAHTRGLAAPTQSRASPPLSPPPLPRR